MDIKCCSKFRKLLKLLHIIYYNCNEWYSDIYSDTIQIKLLYSNIESYFYITSQECLNHSKVCWFLLTSDWKYILIADFFAIRFPWWILICHRHVLIHVLIHVISGISYFICYKCSIYFSEILLYLNLYIMSWSIFLCNCSVRSLENTTTDDTGLCCSNLAFSSKWVSSLSLFHLIKFEPFHIFNDFGNWRIFLKDIGGIVGGLLTHLLKPRRIVHHQSKTHLICFVFSFFPFFSLFI